jgi:hypothetical protein
VRGALCEHADGLSRPSWFLNGILCAGTFANENGVYVGPDGRPVDRLGVPIGPEGTRLSAEGFIVDPSGGWYLPDGSTFPDSSTFPEGSLPQSVSRLPEMVESPCCTMGWKQKGYTCASSSSSFFCVHPYTMRSHLRYFSAISGSNSSSCIS